MGVTRKFRKNMDAEPSEAVLPALKGAAWPFDSAFFRSAAGLAFLKPETEYLPCSKRKTPCRKGNGV